MKNLTIPIPDNEIRSLEVGDSIMLSGVMITGRDAVHKWMIDKFIEKTRPIEGDDQEVYDAIKPILDGSAIYHCGPVVAGLDTADYAFVAAGPTTSIREEPYQGSVMQHFNVKAIIGKGGMGPNTLKACQEQPAVYFHAIGGAASLIARSVKEVITVHKMEFGIPEAMWVIRVQEFPAVVTMDSHGQSIHETIQSASKEKLAELITE